ncbi:alpha/beta hydrolase [Mycolicibacterium austroafricanum]|uniref:alpha/beta hydrolase n=1 Tax=Mycolicibacterium austroafricanum TaxID=39687 RepID=UPI001CA33619|nr:alpha/beta hydrolase [Mycolicibacterium austroafricanum]QZT63804.1 alpha/beta hydrolase [Mycolicibacterium austroafricanum]
MPDRNKSAAARVGGLAIAAGAGAVIACSAAAPAFATTEDVGSSSNVSTSESSRPQSTKAPNRQGNADEPAASGTADDNDLGDDRSDEAEEPQHSDETVTDEEETVTDQREVAAPDLSPVDKPNGTAPVDSIDDETTTAIGDSENSTPDQSPVDTPAGIPSVHTIDDGFAPTGGDDVTPPAGPNLSPAAWTLLGSARRDTEAAAVPPSNHDTTSEPVNTDAAAATDPATAIAPVKAPLGEDESLYTGTPSFVHDVVTFGLYVLKAVLKPFGGLLAFTGLKVPFFTDGIPPFFLTPGLDVERSEFEGMKVWTLTPRKNATEKTVVALHGGAYVATASIFHWWTYADMARDTGATVIVPLQTLVPAGGTAASEVPRTANFISKVIEDRGADNVSVVGDSAGGGLALAAIQELVRRNSRNPARLVLISPWLDVSMSDPRSAEIKDPLLDLTNPTKSGAKWAGEAGTADPQASPLFGSLKGLPPTYVYSSSLDLLTVDTLRLRDRVLAEQVPDVEFRLRKNLIHDWFTFPFLPEAHEDRPSVYQDLLGSAGSRAVGLAR